MTAARIGAAAHAVRGCGRRVRGCMVIGRSLLPSGRLCTVAWQPGRKLEANLNAAINSEPRRGITRPGRARSVAERPLSPGRLRPGDRGASAGREREADPEDRAASWPRTVGDPASVRLDDRTDDREAET